MQVDTFLPHAGALPRAEHTPMHRLGRIWRFTSHLISFHPPLAAPAPFLETVRVVGMCGGIDVLCFSVSHWLFVLCCADHDLTTHTQ